MDEWEWIFPNTQPFRCYSFNKYYWLFQENFGLIAFNDQSSQLIAFPLINKQEFKNTVIKECLPGIYQFWGFQVLHCSSIFHNTSGSVMAFSADTQKGKSTLAHALGETNGWTQLGDESLALNIQKSNIELIHIPNSKKLRENSLKHFKIKKLKEEWFDWPDIQLHLKCIYFLENNTEKDAEISELSKSAAYKRLLEQAFALTLNLPEKNKKIMNDYMNLVSSDIKFYKLDFRHDFSVLENVLKRIEDHSLRFL